MHFDTIETSLFSCRPAPAAYDGGLGWNEEKYPFSGGVDLDLMNLDHNGLDLKGLGEVQGEDLPLILGALTRELCGQVQLLQSLGRLVTETADGAGVERKLVQADAKAQIEAISLIVRTLEKIDSLQRALAEARSDRDAAEGEADYAALVALFETRVEARARELAARGKACRPATVARGAAPRKRTAKTAPAKASPD
ncbi:hypothetical protein BJF92_14105 [Rhizobium rhizosphaerae]|uniref:Uncharacterized protein n=1 Tax=Xaviernesmea rhizosphaerae TaxID=1672749 RepID=A0A1Q9AI89_9HYPH|nr:hypothetical protein [Xaviernesmea rhizosphaerae]OLP54925.1 hypothetical protein BJF92_14105 [Xaviernesmea rhizosphaerae]